MELLLSSVEIMQFQNYLRNYGDSDGDQDWPRVIDIELPNTIPMSMIVESAEIIPNESVDDVFLYQSKIKAHKLYNKYIKIGCEFELNIEASQRRELQTALEDLQILLASDMTLKDLYILFEDAKQEMNVLLTFSLNRFRSDTGEFAKVVTLFDGGRDMANSISPPSTPLPW